MKVDINVSGKDLLFYDLSKSKILKNNSPQIDQPIIFSPKDHTAVKFTLSEDGREAYRNHLKKQVEAADNEKSQYSKICPDLILTDEGAELQTTVRPIMRDSGIWWMSPHYDKPSDIFETYTRLYDEIVRGYQNGTRESYIEDADAEYGWRKATLEDELAFLNADYEKCVTNFEEREERNAVLRVAIIKYAKQLEKSGNGHLEFVGKAKKLESEPSAPLPEDFVEKMRTAAKEFANQYMMKFSQQGSVDISKLLNDVTTKHLDFLKKDRK